MRVQLADGAKQDFADGLRWYRKRSDQAANHFIEETNNTIAKILKAPARPDKGKFLRILSKVPNSPPDPSDEW